MLRRSFRRLATSTRSNALVDGWLLWTERTLEGRQGRVLRRLVLGVRAFASGDWSGAACLLESAAPQVKRLGGSVAQHVGHEFGFNFVPPALAGIAMMRDFHFGRCVALEVAADDAGQGLGGTAERV